VPGLADAADNDAAAALQYQGHSGAKLRSDAPRQRRYSRRFNLEHLATHGYDAGIVRNAGSERLNGLVHRGAGVYDGAKL
jgi:hypothetical protein